MAGDEDSDVELEGVDMEEEVEEADPEYKDEEEEEAPAKAVKPAKAAKAAGASSSPQTIQILQRSPHGTDGRATPDASRPHRYEEARRAQKERLGNLKQFGTSTTGADGKEQRERRIAYLMAQSEVFAHFMEENSDIGASTKKKAGRTRLTETAEDANLMKTAQSKLRVTRILTQPTSITATMRAYQLEGLNWLVKLHDNGINGILADEMGLGKTLQSISLLAYLHEVRGITGPHIVIVPKSVVNNWIRELKKWCPMLRPVKMLGDREERNRVMRDELVAGQFDVCVTSYEGVLKEKSFLCKTNWQYVLIDEAHRIKNPKSSLSKVVRLIPTQFRLLITGTPLQNNLNELWALLNFLLPDIFESEADFETWFSLGDDESKDNVVKKLHTVLRPFMLRRIKKDVEKDLPPKREVKLYIGLTEMQRLWYTKILSKDAHMLNALGGPERVQLLNILMQLRKVCNHPYLFEGAEPGPPFADGPHLWENAGKLVLLSKLLPKLAKQGSRVLIFSQMTRMLDILEDYMRANGHDYCRIDGSTSGDDRDSQMDVFNAPNSPKFVFLLSTRAGGLGINLATADIVVLYDSDWNPQVDLQAMDRAHRIGQTKPVTVFRFVTEGTVEEKIIERADRKLFLDAAVIQQGRLAEQNSALNKNDLMSMVRFGADEIFNSKSSQITDDDIDVILKHGEDRTAEQAQKIQSDVQHNLANFSLSPDAEEGTSLFDFDGQNYRGAKGSRGLMINLPQRERKRNYDVDEYFRDALRQGDKPPPGQREQRKRRGPPMHDFQFFDREALETLLGKEEEMALKRGEAVAVIKELRARGGRGDDEFAESQAQADKLEESLEAEHELNPRDQQRKQKLLQDGFGDWTRKDLRAFLAATERRGREDVETVVRETVAETGKADDEVRRYHATFWRRYKELAEWERQLDKIEKGEKRLQRSLEIRDALAAKIARHAKHWQRLPLNYGASRGKVWTDEEDAFLVNMMHLYGYGNWDRIRVEIRSAWQFNFDWFFKSRNATELQRRADILIRIVEKENEEHAKGEQLKRKSRPAAAAPAAAPAGKTTGRSRKRSVKAGGDADADVPMAEVPMAEVPHADDDDDAPADEAQESEEAAEAMEDESVEA